MTRALMIRAAALALIAAACSVTKPVDLAPGVAGIREYLAAHAPPVLLVSDSVGHARWVHHPRLEGDTLRGLRSQDMPLERIAIPLNQVRGIAAPRFSAGRTLGLFGGLAAALGVVILAAPDPDYSSALSQNPR
ncbi:MAG TPA: hypothetical protein VGJ83_00715 [Gemmatimonadales bacterium]|jgi:hypothetical protein